MFCSVCELPIDHPTPSGRGRECPFCSAVFSRVDGARRHAKSCTQRGDRRLLAGKRGRKTSSCDQCSRVKVHCGSRDQTPCQRCVSRQLDCTFSRYCTNAKHQQTAQEKTSDAQTYRHGVVPLSFLLNVTDKKQDFVTERVVGDEPDGVLLGPTCALPPQTQGLGDQIFDYIDPVLLLTSDRESLVHFDVRGFHDAEQSPLGNFVLPQPSWDRLSERLHLLELQVSQYIDCSDNRMGYFDEIALRRFFTVTNVRTFATIFCRKRHYQYPIIHWPTFSLEDASLPLLMVVSLTGATYSYNPGDEPENIATARMFYSLADSYVFHHLALCVSHPRSVRKFTEEIQLCQAGLLMYALDTLLAGDRAMQHTATAERLPAVISAMRRLDFIGCRHGLSEDWQLFTQREAIVRLVSWAFCADCMATLSHNNPPIFSMLEMSGDLPCESALWDADSASTFGLLRSSQQSHSIRLKDLMTNLLNNGWQENKDSGLSPFHLHVMLCAFQPVVFNLHVTLSMASQSEKLLQALGTWRQLWGRAVKKIPNGQSKWLGVTKNVPGIEYLLRRVIEISVSPEAGSSRYLCRIPSSSSTELHEFIEGYIYKKRK